MLEWLWGSSNTAKASSAHKKSSDPLKELDPSLREYLKAEEPKKYATTSDTAAPKDDRRKWRDKVPAFKETKEPTDVKREAKTYKVPPQSQFQDGRYAHIWKTYTPLEQIENAHKSDQDKVLDVLESHRNRQAEVARTALENCSMEQIAYNDCLNGGTWMDRMTMCRSENKSLERCYIMQQRFLKALGYLSQTDRDSDTNERIQMHADKLYHQMLDEEKAIADAKAAGLPAPPVAPILKGLSAAGETAGTKKFNFEDLSPEAKANLRKRFANLSPSERLLEEKAVLAEMSAATAVAERLSIAVETEQKNKRERKERGEDTFKDKLSSLFGW